MASLKRESCGFSTILVAALAAPHLRSRLPDRSRMRSDLAGTGVLGNPALHRPIGRAGLTNTRALSQPGPRVRPRPALPRAASLGNAHSTDTHRPGTWNHPA